MANRIAPARRVAFDLLLELRRKPESHSDTVLRSKPVEALSALDRNLATTLVMGVLRWRILLEQRIAATLTRADNRLPEPVQVALEVGAFQLLLLDRIPAHAAIFESVELAKESGNPHAAGMVNAVLRKLANAPKLETLPAPPLLAGEIARFYAHPAWMVTRWAKAYGLAEAAAICRFDQQSPPATVRLMDSGAEALLREEGVRLAAASFVARARRVVEGEITSTRAYRERLVRIQDEGSQLIAELAAGAGERARSNQGYSNQGYSNQGYSNQGYSNQGYSNQGYSNQGYSNQGYSNQGYSNQGYSNQGYSNQGYSNQGYSNQGYSNQILDCCAAPGGKTAILAERNPQAVITACDIDPRRLRTMRNFLSRQNRGEQILFRVLDATELPYDQQFDLVLCDAPCSGTGTLARNPEIRHRVTLAGLHRQHERQVKLLVSAMKSLARGGRLVYSTCSLEAEENDSVVSEAMAGQSDLRLLSWRDEMRALEAQGLLHAGSADRLLGQRASDEFLRILPGAPCDGFFAVLISRS